jgi:prephenate dehydratase
MDELVSGSPLIITHEVVLPVQFVLAASEPVPLPAVHRVAAHAQASAQCRGWLRANLPEAVIVDVLSNGAAAAGVAAGEFDAALCAPIGAVRYRLTILGEDIADHPDAVTRFALVERPGPPPQRTGNDITTLAVSIDHDRVGALLAVLTELAVRGVNLTRIESRPTGEKLGRYMFFLDCEGHVAEARFGEALRGLRRVCAAVRFLGSYPRASHGQGERVAPASGLSDSDFAAAEAWLSKLRMGELNESL